MQEWKIRQQHFNLMNSDFKDDLNKVDIKMTNNVIEDAIRHFEEYVNEWIYPSKSYVVAICYATWISEDFDEDFNTNISIDHLIQAGEKKFEK